MTRAAVARKNVREAKRGDRAEALRRSAAERQNPNTLRREITSLDFLDRVRKSHPVLGREIAELPFSIVELLARWYAFDPDRSMAAARRAVAGGHTVATLAKALREARTYSRAGRTSRSLRESGAEEVVRVVRAALGGDIRAEERDLSEPTDRAIDFRFRRAEGDALACSQSIAALIVGPYSDPGSYRTRKRDWLLKAFGLSLFYDHVVLLLEDPGSYRRSLDELQGCRTNFGGPAPSIFVLALNVPLAVPIASGHSAG